MRWFFRMFFRTVRLILGPFMLLWEKLTTPRGVVRPEAEQQRVEAEARGLALYQFRTCPFCLKVRRELRRLSLPVELRDAQHDPAHRRALGEGGGQVKVPCLRITDAQGRDTWVYESDAIIDYLHQRFGQVAE